MAALVLAIEVRAQTPPPSAVAPGPPPHESIPKGEWRSGALRQESAGKLHKLHSTPEGGGEVPYQAWVETSTLLFRADEVEWDEATGDVRASGHVYFHDFRGQHEMWCDRLEYNSDEEAGKFYNVRGQTIPHLTARPGVLTTTSPFFFEGDWAERSGDIYILHDGFVTNCKMPSPWWRMRGPRFVIEPGEKALSYHTLFLLRGVPLFFTPYFYHSLEAEPRKSGFLLPNIGNSSKGGFLLGAGYYWAMNRSHDLTYRALVYTSRGWAHHVDFRGKPREGTEYSAILYGVQDHGKPGTNPPQKYSGVSLFAAGRSSLGDGWTAHGEANYITSLRFRQEWTQSYNEAVGSEMHSVGFLNKNWGGYVFNAVFSRLENFQSVEKQIVNPDTGAQELIRDAVQIRKLPEAEFSGRDRQFWRKLPLWFSFDSSAGLLSRSEPVFSSDGAQLIDRFQTGRFMNRVNLAPHLTGALHFGDFHLIPSLGLRETYYGEGQAPYEDRYRVTGTNAVRSAREFSLDVILPSLSRVYLKKTFLGDKLKHVIEPRATYRYVTGIGSDFDRFIRFDETDLLANTNELLLSLANRIYAKRGDSVQEVVTWELMQKRYFDPTYGGALVEGQRNVFESTADLAAYAFVSGPRGASPIVSSLRISPVGGLGLRWQTDYDPRARGIVNSTLGLDYHWKQYFASASNSEVHPADPALGTPSANQYRGRLGFGDANRRGVSAAVDAIYDYRSRTLQYSTTQATYNTDCCGLSVQYYWNGISGMGGFRVAFSIANIGSFGTLTKKERLF